MEKRREYKRLEKDAARERNGQWINERLAWIAIPPPQQTEGLGITMLHTTDGGQNWQHTTIADPVVALVDVPHFLDAQQGWLEASSTPGAGHAGSDIWHTTDGGQTWAKITSSTSGRIWFQTSVVHISSDNTYVLDPSHAWATDTQSGQLYSTTDGGNHWFAASTTAYHLKALSFTDASNGWGVTSETLLHTTDGGKTWQQIHYVVQ